VRTWAAQLGVWNIADWCFLLFRLIVDGYPELPYVSIQKRVAKGWWDNQERKNFNETVSSLL
jgi:hypothetical protein